MISSYGEDVQSRKYGDKEFVSAFGLDEYDSEARWYYPAIMRTTTMDPLCEKYPYVMPYLYCNGNPVMLIDLYGKEPVTPAPIWLIGTHEYYVFRQLDFEKRNPGERHPYYIPYGYVNCFKFLSYTKEFLTDDGAKWDTEVAKNLQLRMETALRQYGDHLSLKKMRLFLMNLFINPIKRLIRILMELA